MDMGTHDPKRQGDWSHLHSFAVPHPKLTDRGDRGWLSDEDRDSAQAAKLRELVSEMDTRVAAWLSDSMATDDDAEYICGLWVAIRQITQGRDITQADGGQP